MKPSNYYIGKKVKIKGNSYGFNLVIGSTVTIGRANGNAFYIKDSPTNAYLSINDFELSCLTAKEIDDEILDLNTQISDLNLKKEFMKESGLEEFDETQFKVFKTLSTLDNKDLSSLEKSKLIAI